MKRKLNKKGIIALTSFVVSAIILVHDYIMLCTGATYTLFGLLTAFIAFNILSESYDYMKERVNNNVKNS